MYYYSSKVSKKTKLSTDDEDIDDVTTHRTKVFIFPISFLQLSLSCPNFLSTFILLVQVFLFLREKETATCHWRVTDCRKIHFITFIPPIEMTLHRYIRWGSRLLLRLLLLKDLYCQLTFIRANGMKRKREREKHPYFLLWREVALNLIYNSYSILTAIWTCEVDWPMKLPERARSDILIHTWKEMKKSGGMRNEWKYRAVKSVMTTIP